MIVNNFVNTGCLFDNPNMLYQHTQDQLAIPFFGMHFCSALLKSMQFVKDNIREYSNKFDSSDSCFRRPKQ